MSRWRWGNGEYTIRVPVDAMSVIAVDDLCYLDAGDLFPATGQADQGSLAANQILFQSMFAGVAMEASPEGNSDPIRIATRGVFLFDLPAGDSFFGGDMLGACENVAGDALLAQKLVKVSTTNKALGRVVAPFDVGSVTTAYVELISTIFLGGVMPPS